MDALKYTKKKNSTIIMHFTKKPMICAKNIYILILDLLS